MNLFENDMLNQCVQMLGIPKIEINRFNRISNDYTLVIPKIPLPDNSKNGYGSDLLATFFVENHKCNLWSGNGWFTIEYFFNLKKIKPLKITSSMVWSNSFSGKQFNEGLNNENGFIKKYETRFPEDFFEDLSEDPKLKSWKFSSLQDLEPIVFPLENYLVVARQKDEYGSGIIVLKTGGADGEIYVLDDDVFIPCGKSIKEACFLYENDKM